MIRRPPRSTLSSSSAASDVYKRQITGSNSTSARTHHHNLARLTFALSKHTLNDVLVGRPIPKADNRRSDKYPKTRIVVIHRIARFKVKHVVCAVGNAVCSYV